MILALTLISVMLVSFAACANRDGVNDTDPNNGTTPNDNNGNVIPDDENTPDDRPDNQPDGNGMPNTLNGQTAEGTVYHILNSSATDADNASASEFMLVTEEGKHYRVKGSQNGTDAGNMTRDTANSDTGENGQGSVENAPTENTGNNGGDVTLGDRVRIDIEEGTDNGSHAVVEKCKITVVDKFEGTLLQAKVYTKTGLPSYALSEMNVTSGWYHQRFADYSDFGVFLDRYDLRGYVESMGGNMGGENFPTLDEEFFKNNSIHIFAVPYVGAEANVNDGGSLTEDSSTVYKDGDTLYLMTKDDGYGDYLSSLGKGENMLENAGDAVGDAGSDIMDGAGDAARDMTKGGNVLQNAGDAVKDMAEGLGDAAKNVTDGIMGRNSENGSDTGADIQDGIMTGTLYKLYIVALGQDGDGLKTGIVLIDNK